MKQQVPPAVIAICIVAVLGILIFVGMRALAPTSTPEPGTNAAPRQPQTINGVKVPSNVPAYYWTEHQGNKGQAAPAGP